MGQALKYMHSKDLIHRDVKPKNIMINIESIVISNTGMVNFPGHGKAYAEYVAAPESHLAKMPNELSFENAAAENVLFTPDVLPLNPAEDTDGNSANHSLSVLNTVMVE